MRSPPFARRITLAAALLLAATGPCRVQAASAKAAPAERGSRLDLAGTDDDAAALRQSAGSESRRSLPRGDASALVPPNALPPPTVDAILCAPLLRALHPAPRAARRGARAPPDLR